MTGSKWKLGATHSKKNVLQVDVHLSQPAMVDPEDTAAIEATSALFIALTSKKDFPVAPYGKDEESYDIKKSTGSKRTGRRVYEKVAVAGVTTSDRLTALIGDKDPGFKDLSKTITDWVHPIGHAVEEDKTGDMVFS